MTRALGLDVPVLTWPEWKEQLNAAALRQFGIPHTPLSAVKRWCSRDSAGSREHVSAVYLGLGEPITPADVEDDPVDWDAVHDGTATEEDWLAWSES